MERPGVPEAMARAFSESEGDLEDRLIAALKAAQALGGDLRGRQSSALLIAEKGARESEADGRVFDLRVDDARDPIGELERLARLRKAHLDLAEGSMAWERGEEALAREIFARMRARAPEEGQLALWAALAMGEDLPAGAEERWREARRRIEAAKGRIGNANENG